MYRTTVRNAEWLLSKSQKLDNYTTTGPAIQCMSVSSHG